MPRIESDYPQEWLRIAEKDYSIDCGNPGSFPEIRSHRAAAFA